MKSYFYLEIINLILKMDFSYGPTALYPWLVVVVDPNLLMEMWRNCINLTSIMLKAESESINTPLFWPHVASVNRWPIMIMVINQHILRVKVMLGRMEAWWQWQRWHSSSLDCESWAKKNFEPTKTSLIVSRVHLARQRNSYMMICWNIC